MFAPLENFFHLTVDPFWKDFVLQERKWDVMEVVTLCKMMENHESIPTLPKSPQHIRGKQFLIAYDMHNMVKLFSLHANSNFLGKIRCLSNDTLEAETRKSTASFQINFTQGCP